MKEIKFRAWHKEAKEMLTHNCQSHLFRWMEDGQPVELMQYTGLKDKNGKEIYSGDILQPSAYKGASRFKNTVIFKSGMFCFEQNDELVQEDKPLYESLKIADMANNGYEIVGNIYED